MDNDKVEDTGIDSKMEKSEVSVDKVLDMNKSPMIHNKFIQKKENIYDHSRDRGFIIPGEGRDWHSG